MVAFCKGLCLPLNISLCLEFGIDSNDIYPNHGRNVRRLDSSHWIYVLHILQITTVLQTEF